METYIEPCSSTADLSQVNDWVTKIRARNEQLEGSAVLTDEEKLDEAEAEILYTALKKGIASLSSGASHWFWLKWLFYQRWKRPHLELELVEETIKRERAKTNLGDGFMIAHTPRPYWIRPPKGGDAFDRGEIAERRDIPL